MCGSVRAPGRVGPRPVRAGPAAARWVNSGCVRGGLYLEMITDELCDAVSVRLTARAWVEEGQRTGPSGPREAVRSSWPACLG